MPERAPGRPILRRIKLPWLRAVVRAISSLPGQPGDAHFHPYREPLRFALLVLWLSLVPAFAHAGMWNGGLCTVYQQVLDNELLEVVSLWHWSVRSCCGCSMTAAAISRHTCCAA